MYIIHQFLFQKVQLNIINHQNIMPLDSFLKFYVMRSTQIDLFGIYHVKEDVFVVQKMLVIHPLERFV